MAAQLRLWSRDDTQLKSDPRVTLTIRESVRARRLILQALPPRTVEVVVPKGMPSRAIQSFLRDHGDWIDRAGLELLANYPDAELNPSAIELKAVGERVEVRYLDARGSTGRYRYSDGRLSLYCAHRDLSDATVLLRRWLLQQGQGVLKPWLSREAARTGLAPSRCQVRLQKTRWGSCSATGTISVNAALLLVQPELVRYLIVHELCHLKHLSHSKRYWRVVAQHEPDYRALDRRLAASWREMPAWLFTIESTLGK